MPKYGRGLNREIVAEVNGGIIQEPFRVTDVRRMINRKMWKPEPTNKYINSCLANASSETHSLTYKNYFQSSGGGAYIVRKKFKGMNWL